MHKHSHTHTLVCIYTISAYARMNILMYIQKHLCVCVQKHLCVCVCMPPCTSSRHPSMPFFLFGVLRKEMRAHTHGRICKYSVHFILALTRIRSARGQGQDPCACPGTSHRCCHLAELLVSRRSLAVFVVISTEVSRSGQSRSLRSLRSLTASHFGCSLKDNCQ
jgi:hypothetical protein